MGRDHQVWCCWFGVRVFDTHGCLLLWFPSNWLMGCCGFGLRLRRPGRLADGGHYRVVGRLCDWFRRGIWIWGGVVVVVLTTRPFGPLGFRSGRLV